MGTRGEHGIDAVTETPEHGSLGILSRVAVPNHFVAEISLVPRMRDRSSNPWVPDADQHVNTVV